ncbi:hypothetical protein BT96DRAFT_335381 [Gymnopus androsaceus JB14]|uniref:Uncharacterized protein n=1 Tax=Gymnopus androsaceus JB14 TaxID=1447944 RepID=A0A6A4GZU8_9AGAR|nr:hypothetical protein BT96DRAFT_335381 [Gymnopus androsaceus JB14]
MMHLKREPKETEELERQYPNYIDGVWHCSNCGCPESIAVIAAALRAQTVPSTPADDSSALAPMPAPAALKNEDSEALSKLLLSRQPRKVLLHHHQDGPLHG